MTVASFFTSASRVAASPYTARINAENERRRAEEQRAREEAARLEAMRQGEVERARVQAENEARHRAVQQQQDHERQLTALSQDKKKKQLTWIVVAVVGVLVFGGAGGGYAFWSSQKEAERIQKLQQDELAAKNAQLEKLMADLKTQQDQMAAAQAELTNAKSDADRANAQAKIAAAQAAQQNTQKTIAQVKANGPKPTSGPKPACNCQPGDPLCSCL